MGTHPRFYRPDLGVFHTSRTRNCELWFVNNPSLEQAILAQAARCKDRYGAKLYALAIEGDHIQMPLKFPEGNQSNFMRDFNSYVANAVTRLVENYPGGGLFARRFSSEFLPTDKDIEKQFFYTVLQPVQDGLVERISDFPGYNCFHDAVWGLTRTFRIVNWTRYNNEKRWKKNIRIQDYEEEFVLQYDRLPGYEHLSQKEYAALMGKKLEEHRVAAIKKREAEGKFGFAGKEFLKSIIPGTPARNPKVSTRKSFRPRVISVNADRREEIEAWYFETFFEYKKASLRYRLGDFHAEFPPGTNKPPIMHDPPRLEAEPALQALP